MKCLSKQNRLVFVLFMVASASGQAQTGSCQISATDLRVAQSYAICGSDPLQARCAMALQAGALSGAVAGGAWETLRQRQLVRLAQLEERVRSAIQNDIGPWPANATAEQAQVRAGLQRFLATEVSRIQPHIDRGPIENGIRILEAARDRRINDIRVNSGSRPHVIQALVAIEETYANDSIRSLQQLLARYPANTPIPSTELLRVVFSKKEPNHTVAGILYRSAGSDDARRALRGLVHYDDYLGQVLSRRMTNHLPDENWVRQFHPERARQSFPRRLARGLYWGVESGVRTISTSLPLSRQYESSDDRKAAMRLVLNGRTPEQFARALLESMAASGWAPARELTNAYASLRPSAMEAVLRWGTLGAAARMATANTGRSLLAGAALGTGAAGLAVITADFTLTPTQTACATVAQTNTPVDSNCHPVRDHFHPNSSQFLDRILSDDPEMRAQAAGSLANAQVCRHYQNMAAEVRAHTQVSQLQCGSRRINGVINYGGRQIDLNLSLRAPDDRAESDPIHQIQAASRFSDDSGH